MPKTSTKPVDAEEIAEMADRGQDISAHFTNQFIRTKQDHRAAVARIEELMSAEPGTPKGNELDKLATLMDAYEGEQVRQSAREAWTTIQQPVLMSQPKKLTPGLAKLEEGEDIAPPTLRT
jgi:hypothetical protein